MPKPYERKLKDGTVRWRVVYRLHGKQYPATFATFEGAQELCNLIDDHGVEQALHIMEVREKARSESREVWTVAGWAEHYVNKINRASEDQKVKYRSYVKGFGVIGELPLEGLTEEAIVEWMDDLVEGDEDEGREPNSYKTIKNKHSLLSQAVEAAIERKLMVLNPAKGLRPPVDAAAPEEMTFLTTAEFEFFLGFFEPHWKPFVEVLFLTGLRFSEAAALKAEHVDLQRRRIDVRQAWKGRSGKRKIGPPKTKAARRSVPLTERAVQILEQQLKGRRPHQYVFTNTKGDPHTDGNLHAKAWQPAVKLANGLEVSPVRRDERGQVIAPAEEPLGKQPRPHDARHSFASWLVNQNAPLNLVKEVMGHESITVTVDRYSHLLPDHLDRLTEALEKAFVVAA